MTQELTELIIDGLGIFRKRRNSSPVRVTPISEPRVLNVYKGNEVETIKQIRTYVPNGANAYVFGYAHRNHLDCHPIQYYKMGKILKGKKHHEKKRPRDNYDMDFEGHPQNRD